jgi:hypothetical protein
MQGPITSARACQLNQQVNSFLSSSIHEIENKLLPLDVIVLSNQVIDMDALWNIKGMMEFQEDMHKLEVEPNSTSSPTQGSELVCNQIDAQGASQLCLGRSTYAYKDNNIIFPMTLVSCQNSPRVSGNSSNKSTSRI